MTISNKILFVTQFLPAPSSNGQTGGTISNLQLLRELGTKFPLTVLSFDTTSSEVDFVNEPFEVISRPAPAWRAPQLMRHWLRYVRTEVSAELRRGQMPGAVIATTSTLASFDVLARNTTRVSLVRAYENFGFACPWVPLSSRYALAKLAAVRRFQDPRLMRESDVVWTNSQFMRIAIASRFGLDQGSIHVLPQLCDVTPDSSTRPTGTIGFVNRGPDKGLEFVLELARRSPIYKYYIYGHETDASIRLPQNVEWRGWASDRNLMFASANLWIVPSLWAEPFGRVSIEAQAANRAVLVAGHGGLPETVNDPRFKIKGFNADEWLERMHKLMRCSVKDLSKNGQGIRSDFSSKQYQASLADIVSKATTKKVREIHD